MSERAHATCTVKITDRPHGVNPVAIGLSLCGLCEAQPREEAIVGKAAAVDNTAHVPNGLLFLLSSGSRLPMPAFSSFAMNELLNAT